MTENSELREKMLAEAIRIGDWLLECADKGETGWSWKTMTMDMDRVVGWETSDSIYAGAAGVSWFLMHLYKITGGEDYLEGACQGLRWAAEQCRKFETNYYAFITGRLGVAYAMLHLSRIAGDKTWLDTALEIAKPCERFTSPEYEVDDFINGHSGAIIAVLHLYIASGESWLLEAADGFTRNLLNRAHQGKKGFYWDRGFQSISGLCGFSHGAGGIGWVFLELGRFLRNPAFYRVAEQAFLYESVWFDPEKGNWMDLRKGIYSDDDEREHRKALREGDMEFFTRGGDMNAWCHGSAGNGLGRLRAMRVLEGEARERAEREAFAALEKTRLTDVDNINPITLFILCHGAGGNADLFIEAWRVLGDPTYLRMAERVAERVLAYREAHHFYMSGFRDAAGGEDRSLFMGTAGIGCFLLRLLEPRQVPSILAPFPDAELTGEIPAHCTHLTLSEQGITAKLLERSFLRTMTVVAAWAPDLRDRFFATRPLASTEFNLNRLFIQFMETEIPRLPENVRERIHDIFVMEREKVRLDEDVVSLCRLHIRDKALAENAKPLTELGRDDFMALRLVAADDIVIASTDWDWDIHKPETWLQNLQQDPDVWPVVLKPLPTGVMEERLSPLSYTILGAFEGGKTVAEACVETINAFEELTGEQQEMITGKVFEQVKQALLVGILVKTAE